VPAEGVIATLVVLMATGKVFSPQYLIWLLPLGLLVSIERGGSLPFLFIVVMALTQLIFPFSYGSLHALRPWACALVLLRTGLLLYWALGLVSPLMPSSFMRKA